MIPVLHVLGLTSLLLFISLIGLVVNRRNIISLLMCVELMLLAVNMNFIAFSYWLQNIAGQVFVFFILTVAAAETAIGLAIVILLYRSQHNVDVEGLDHLKG
ncbi:MAG TPA: NADH-quinone oxidoreductase subunit NuoK [Gammaproteobacteria bacterium]|nr:NADH-quinone oxidoreductase subunit NuoK [Gammaproteobacteria bacterium]